MKMLSETSGLERLRRLRDGFRSAIESEYEHKAKPCSTCETPGACCLDAHFVNVRISRLEAVAIDEAIGSLDDEQRAKLYRRIKEVIERFGLDKGISTTKTFACPMYEKSIGCLVHDEAKPFPCIQHACYENQRDLPPGELLDEAEIAVERLNRKVYGRRLPLLPLPLALRNVLRTSSASG
jgi:hypothetical protein